MDNQVHNQIVILYGVSQTIACEMCMCAVNTVM